MTVLSDFTVVNNSTRLLLGGTLDLNFATGGRHNSDAVLDVAALGGYRGADSGMTIRVRLNGHLLDSFMVHRWQDHSLIVMDRITVVIPPSVLRSSGANTLGVDPQYEASSDYAFLGEVICHFHQSD